MASKPAYSMDRVVIKISPAAKVPPPKVKKPLQYLGDKKLDAALQKEGVTKLWAVFPAAQSQSLQRYYTAVFAKPKQSMKELLTAVASLKQAPLVELAERDVWMPVHYVPNDTRYPDQLGFHWFFGVEAPSAWDLSTGTNPMGDVVVAIADTGVHMVHADLSKNRWINLGETSKIASIINGFDNDFNGYVDDLHGYDFVDSLDVGGEWVEVAGIGEDYTDPDNWPLDHDGHGTHVAGIAAAVTDNAAGVAGLGFNAKYMTLRIGARFMATASNTEVPPGTQVGLVSMTAAAEALVYAANNGATVFNASWGTSSAEVLTDALDFVRDHTEMVISCSAGNGSSDIGTGSPIGSYFPSRPEIVTVAGIDDVGFTEALSNWGDAVDVAAPGSSVLSTYVSWSCPGGACFATDEYERMTGTSQAAPHVTGAIALAKSYCWGANRGQIRAAIRASGRALAHNAHYTAGDLGVGRFDARRFLDRLCGADSPPSSFALSAPGTGAVLSSRSDIRFSWTSSVDPEGEPVQYTLFIYDPLNPAQYVEYKYDGISGTTSYTVPAGSLAPASYRWRVVAFAGMKTTGTAERAIQIVP